MVDKEKEVEKFLNYRPSYLKRSPKNIQQIIPANIKIITKVLKRLRKKSYISKKNKVSRNVVKTIKSKGFKRLFWDIETSYNIVSSWRVGNKISLSHDNIIKERAIICICYKWAHEKEVKYLYWDKGNDKQMIEKFVNILNQADESIGHNSDAFDLKWLRTRCLYNRVPMWPKYSTLDTYKVAKNKFNLNSNKLDYLGKFLGFNGKLETGGLKLWDDVVLRNDKIALNTMINYCKRDVELLENVYNEINKYSEPKTHYGVVIGESKCSCSHCGSENRTIKSYKTTTTGIRHIQFQCKDCNRYYQVALTTWNLYNKLNMKK